MPPANPASGGRGHVSIFDRRGQKPNRGRSQAGGASNANQSTSHRGSGSGNQSAHGDDTSHGANALFNKTCMLRVHEDTFSLSDLVLNPAFFPGIREGDIVAIRPMPDGDDSNGDQTLSKGLLDTESGTSGAHSSEPPNTGKGKGAGPPHSKPSATPANGGQVADTGERGPDLKTGPARAELRDLSRGAPLDAKSDNDGGHHTDQPLSSSNSKAPSRGPATRDGNDEHVSEVDRADSDHNESILRPDPHREILLNVGEVRRDTQQLQASVSSSVVRALWGDYLANQRVNIRKVDIFNAEERESIRADFVEIAFRDQYVGRSDMWRLWRSLSLKTVHNNKPANMEGLIRASVRRIYKDGRQIPCGYIDLQSQPIFRSESGRFLIFIQMSEEMWSYQEDGNLCFEKVVNSFLAELFRRWKEKQLNHMVTIVMFSRWFYNVRDSLFFQDLILDEDSGKYYRDYYKVIADMEVRPDWSAFLPEILSESNSYRRDIQEIQTSAGHRLRGDLSKAHQGNILEAINLGINSFASHHVDRDLSRTGLSTIVITPSFGVFDVTKNMLRMTTERMLHYGMRTDLVCLAPRPLFKPPLFRFKAPIVPTEQEQMRALLLREQDRIIARKARDTELNSVSPLDEGPPGFISPVTSMPASALPKDRGEKAPLPAPAQAVVDPIMLDPLYFNDENWEQNLLPYLAGSRHRSNAADDGAKAPTGLAARTTAFGSNGRDTKPDLESMFSDSIASALISNHGNVSDIPSSILELRTADYPFFAQSTTSSASRDNRIVYYYFPYWVDCGFYNIDEPASEHDSKFRPRCKMDDLPITGVANYMRVAPSVPDLDLSVFDPELLAAQKFDTQSVSGIDSIADGRFKYRDEDSRSIDAQFFSATRDIGHGRILPLDRKLPLGHSRERLLDLFAEYDRQAITGLGTNRGIAAGAMSVGDLAPGGGGGADSAAGAMSQSVQLTHTGGTSEHRLPLGSLHAASQQSILLPSNASVHWDDHQQGPYSRHLDSRVATERIEVGSAGSVEALDNLLATVSTSASPNLGHGQLIKPPPRAEHCASTSSSVPRDASLGGVGMAGAQRSSIFMRNSSQRKRPQQHVKMQSSLEAAEPTESNMPPTAPQASQRRIAQGHGASPERSLYSIASGSRSRVAIADTAGRPGLHRVAESPQSITRGQYIQHNYNRLSGEMSLVTPIERLPVAESVAKQSHLDEIRTFRGHDAQGVSPKHQSHSLQQTPPGMAMPTGVPSYRHSTLPNALLSENDFHLTLPNGRQVTALPYNVAGPSQPSAPADYHSGSPQYGKGLLLNDRMIFSHLPDVSPKGMRGRHNPFYNPCNPGRYPPTQNELYQRWALALPTYSSLSSYTPKWRSLCTPASLPLVTCYCPPDLDIFYNVFSYDIQTQETLSEDPLNSRYDDSEEFSLFMAYWVPASKSVGSDQMSAMQRTDRSTRIMLKEMVYLRLAQGFQFIKTFDLATPRGPRDRAAGSGKRGPLFKHNGRPDGVERLAVRSGSGSGGGAGIATGDTEPSAAPAAVYVSTLPTSVSQKVGRSIWMSNGRQVQMLEFQDSSVSNHTPGVTVTRWERKKPFNKAEQRYRFHMWSRSNNAGYTLAKINFQYPRDDEVNWNGHDYQILGFQTNSTKATRYWRARYILVPCDHLGSDTIANSKQNSQMSVEDVRIANFEKFLDHILRLLRKDERAMLEERFLGALPAEMRQSLQPATSSGYGPGALGHASKKSLGLSDLTPSMLMQIRYTTMYPVPYLSYQLYCYVNDKIFLDPTRPISLPQPAVTAMGLPGPLNVESPYTHLACALQHQTAGVELRNLRWHYAYYSSIFAGYQLVDWILVNFEGVPKRASAVNYGNRLMERGLFFPVQSPGPFMDGYHFYAFTETAIECKNQLILAGHPSSGRGQSSLMSSVGLADKANRYVTSSNNASPSVSRPSSRQGSNAPSVFNNDGDATSSAPSGGTKKSALLANSSALAGPPIKGTNVAGGHDTAADSSSDSRSTGAQPASKLRVRTDVTSQLSRQSVDAAGSQSSNADSGPHNNADSAMASASHRPDFAVSSQQPEQLQVPGSRAAPMGASRPTSTMQQQSPGCESLPASDYRKTPDVYPELSKRWARRSLPKQLYQTREFKLDLDLQRKSSRVENCMVHLDAVQNPMTCFHLSINWLNCTNHLIDEMAQGWARVAERCGMRLVEAPRAQDAALDDSHPFHSPICIDLKNAPPPPVEAIFDDEWVQAFDFFGDSDSEPETSSDADTDLADYSGSDSEASTATSNSEANVGLASKRRRARIVRRMGKCLPTYAFERELLEEQDFILDVEAEANYPDCGLLQRDYTIEKLEYQYTQYVHRSGTAFVQICGPGQFLWINNHLFTSHQNRLRPQAVNQQQQQQQQQQHQAPNNSSATSSSQAGQGPAGALQASLGASGGRASDAQVTMDTSTTPSAPLVQSTPSGSRQIARVQGNGFGESIALPSPSSGNRMIPSYYPTRNARDMWPHQVLHPESFEESLSTWKDVVGEGSHKLPVIEQVGLQPADFDSVNAAVTRAAYASEAKRARPAHVAVTTVPAILCGSVGSSSGGSNGGGGEGGVAEGFWHGDLPSDLGSELAVADDDEGDGGSATPPAGLPQSEANPDTLRAHFVEMCKDKNGLAMFWEQTINRYRSGWRDYISGSATVSDLPKGRPMIIDLFSEGLWQLKWHGKAQTAPAPRAPPPPPMAGSASPFVVLSPPLAPPPPPARFRP